ncbi:MAG: hypothetical protein ACRD0G_03300 [Acidimicrobiales bacterium]
MPIAAHTWQPHSRPCPFERLGAGWQALAVTLMQTVIGHNLVDEFRVMIDPVVVGGD